MSDHSPSGHDFDPTDPIAAAWASQGESEAVPYIPTDLEALADSVQKAHRKDQRRLFWLNVREVIPSLIGAVVFGSLAPSSHRPLATMTSALIMFGVACFLAITSIQQLRADRRWGASVREQLGRRLAQVNHGAWLMRHVGWWYFLPFSVAIPLLYYGLDDEFTLEGQLTFFGLGAALMFVAYRINRRIGRKRYEPEAERLESILVDFDRPV